MMTQPARQLPELPPGDVLLLQAGACNYLQISRWTLNEWVAKGLVPPPRRLGRRPYWLLSEIKAAVTRLRPEYPDEETADGR